MRLPACLHIGHIQPCVTMLALLRPQFSHPFHTKTNCFPAFRSHTTFSPPFITKLPALFPQTLQQLNPPGCVARLASPRSPASLCTCASPEPCLSINPNSLVFSCRTHPLHLRRSLHQPPRQQGAQDQCICHMGSRQCVQGVFRPLLLHRVPGQAQIAKRQV
jgi:hypothetical protein